MSVAYLLLNAASYDGKIWHADAFYYPRDVYASAGNRHSNVSVRLSRAGIVEES